MKKGVAAALRRHRALKSLGLWRGKPPATLCRATFSSAWLGVMWEHFVLNEMAAQLQTRGVFYWRDKHGHEFEGLATCLAGTCRLFTNFELGMGAFHRAGPYPYGNSRRFDHFLHINIPEGQLVAAQGELNAL